MKCTAIVLAAGQLVDKARLSGLPEDAQAAVDAVSIVEALVAIKKHNR